jgi:hypothetical protein
MIPAAEVAEAALVCSQVIRDGVPPLRIKILHGNTRADKSHTATEVGDSKPTPILLASQDGCSSGERRLPRARIGQEDDLLCLEIVWNP